MHDDLEEAIRYTEIINNIVNVANNISNPADFGANVARILNDNELIDIEIYKIVSGQL